MALHSTLNGASLHVGPGIKLNDSLISARRNINLIDSASITWTVTDDSGSDETEIVGVAPSAGVSFATVESLVLFRI